MHYREGHLPWSEVSLSRSTYQTLAAFLIRSRGDNSLQYDDDFLEIVCWIYICSHYKGQLDCRWHTKLSGTS